MIELEPEALGGSDHLDDGTRLAIIQGVVDSYRAPPPPMALEGYAPLLWAGQLDDAGAAAVRFDDGRIKLVPVGCVEGFERTEMLRSYLVGRVKAYAEALAQTERLLEVLDAYDRSRSRLLASLDPPDP